MNPTQDHPKEKWKREKSMDVSSTDETIIFSEVG